MIFLFYLIDNTIVSIIQSKEVKLRIILYIKNTKPLEGTK